jgi:hypothetical protein
MPYGQRKRAIREFLTKGKREDMNRLWIASSLAILLSTPFSHQVKAQAFDWARFSRNMETINTLSSTPLSILDFGLYRLDESVRGMGFIFDQIRVGEERGSLQAYYTYVLEDGNHYPAIVIRGFLFDLGQRPARTTEAYAMEACQNILNQIAIIVGVFFRDDNQTNPFMGRLFLGTGSQSYRDVDFSSFGSLAYLAADVPFGPREQNNRVRCGRFWQ